MAAIASRVLIVDDNPSDADALREALVWHHFVPRNVENAGTLAAAEARLRVTRKDPRLRFSVIVADLTLPDGRPPEWAGLELAEYIGKEIRPYYRTATPSGPPAHVIIYSFFGSFYRDPTTGEIRDEVRKRLEAAKEERLIINYVGKDRHPSAHGQPGAILSAILTLVGSA